MILVGIRRGGVPVARQLAHWIEQLESTRVPLGSVDITLYRDDAATALPNPRIGPSEIPGSLERKRVVLVDDVVNTGRTIRAAMDALMDFGRPRVVQVVGLVDRGHRELPIKLDYVGKNVPTNSRETVRLQGANGSLDPPLEVVVVASEEGGES